MVHVMADAALASPAIVSDASINMAPSNSAHPPALIVAGGRILFAAPVPSWYRVAVRSVQVVLVRRICFTIIEALPPALKSVAAEFGNWA